MLQPPPSSLALIASDINPLLLRAAPFLLSKLISSQIKKMDLQIKYIVLQFVNTFSILTILFKLITDL